MDPGPSPGFRSRGAKNQKGGPHFKIQHWICVATGGQTWNGGAPILNGGPGTTAPPAGDDPVWTVMSNVVRM